VHKLIVAAERQNQAKARKDIMQAELLIVALSDQRPLELAEAWETAWNTGPRWREKLDRGRARLDAGTMATLERVLAHANASRKRRGR
jgi:hypothetical protein